VPPAAMLETAALPAAVVEPQHSDGEVNCSSSSELPGCELMRAQLMPASSPHCSADADCDSLHCSGGSCVAASCSDGIRNQGESAVDCAGPCAARCVAGNECRSSADCASGLSCPPVTLRCALPSCQDGLQNGNETAVDCGGACAGCAAGSACGGDSDCATGICRDGACDAASCDDLVRNQDETDVDCGGVCGACGPGRACALDGDCQSGACQDGRCCGGQEGDCTRCARRLSTSLQCTSNGASAEVTASCNDFLQCLSDNAVSCPRRRSAGCSDAGGVCDVSRFGGNSAQGIALADGIIGTAQCNF
ncbi:MAG TPA: hypothetical protein VG963_04620, partial [Polyangiaceae bacterium]|nr:hypothetical protein [Polyangiaceae bacterium]